MSTTELETRILENLTTTGTPVTIGQLAKALTVESTVLRPVLRVLRRDGKISCAGERRSARYSLANV